LETAAALAVRAELREHRGAGVLAFGLSAYSRYRTDWPGGGQVGLHGTNEPELVPGHISNGCIRLRNRDVRRLDRLMSVGTPILIR
jgi:lipoprotein-anchoring transpeptidase ErfK/SrfK